MLTKRSFAFQFLLAILKHVKDGIERPQKFLSSPETCSGNKRGELCDICKNMQRQLGFLRDRMRKTCAAHLRWVCYMAERSDHGFSPHYWAMGDSIAGWSNNDYLSPRSLTDTPFQIIKLQDYEEMEPVDPWTKTLWVVSLGNVIGSWISQLRTADKREKYTIARPDQEGTTQKYNLADHVWIFRAIKSVEALNLFDFFNFFPSSEAESYFLKDAANSRSEEFRRIMLKRFTTKNPHSGQRMLATSRTPSISRFLLHSKDTTLFYAMNTGFFDGEIGTEKGKHGPWINKIDVWKETMNAQMDYEETQDMDWTKPLWYALAITAGSSRRSINNNMSADEMLRKAAETLLRISSPNGIFPGALDEAQEPAVFDSELLVDGYWRTTFEIPLVFWRYGKIHLERQFNRGSTAKNKDKSQSPAVQLRHPMMKRMAFSNFSTLIDQKRLVDVSDDWLAPEPTLVKFDFEPELLDSEGGKAFVNHLGENFAESKSIIAQVKASHGSDSLSFQDEDGQKGVVIDVSKRSSGEEIRSKLQTNRQLLGDLRNKRTVRSAKKRLVWLPLADKETAYLCCQVSPQLERDNMLGFFEKHTALDKHFSDRATAYLNEWVTELHFSYYRKLDFDPGAKEMLPSISDLSCVIIGPQQLVRNTDTEKVTLARVGLGFRFVGDFFDRNWTCHFVEHNPQVSKATKAPSGSPSSSKLEEANDRAKHRIGSSLIDRLSEQSNTEYALPIVPSCSTRHKHPWQQRKVLELVFFNTALQEIERSTKDIFDWVKGRIFVSENKDYALEKENLKLLRLLKKPFQFDATEPLNTLAIAEALQDNVQSVGYDGSDGYFSIIERWRFFDQVLQTVEDDLSTTLKIISYWSRREKDREVERPRWTRNDETTYRSVINKLEVASQRHIRDLENLKTNIRAFRESLTGKLTSMREDIDFRGSQNINLFTYVTVVFLPLGFATGIFSMSEAPGRFTLELMVATAMVALSITFLALVNAKHLDKYMVRPATACIRLCSRLIMYPFPRVGYSLFIATFIRVELSPVLSPVSTSTKHVTEHVQFLLRGNKHLRYWQVSLERFQKFDFIERVKKYREKHKTQEATGKDTTTTKPVSSTSGMDRSEETNGSSVASASNQKTPDLESGIGSP